VPFGILACIAQLDASLVFSAQKTIGCIGWEIRQLAATKLIG
jgi:hypothetical protein